MMILFRGWDNANVIETRPPEDILLNSRHIVSVSFDWRCDKTTVVSLSNMQFYVVEDFATIKNLLMSGAVNV